MSFGRVCIWSGSLLLLRLLRDLVLLLLLLLVVWGLKIRLLLMLLLRLLLWTFLKMGVRVLVTIVSPEYNAWRMWLVVMAFMQVWGRLWEERYVTERQVCACECIASRLREEF